MVEQIGELKERAVENNIEFETTESDSGDIKRFRLEIPEARKHRNVVVRPGDSLDGILDVDFEKYKFIKGYEAIWSADQQVIECSIESSRSRPYPSSIAMRGFAELGESVKTDEDGNIKRVFLASPGSGDIQISVGLSSDEHAVLTSLSRRFGPRRVRERLSIRFEGASITCHDNALELLESLGNSVLFQSDLRTERPWILKSRVEVRGLRRPNRRNEDTDFTPPEFRYDNEAISLYWYGRTARGMPLLQYLAYYQVIEYYFPRYSRIEAQDRIKSIIKDPTFNIDKQQDIAKILNVVSRSGSGGLGSERSQMRSTVEGCVTDKELREFIKEDDDRSKFFGGGKTRGLSDQGIPVRNQSHDIREEVAYRLYDIRCRIVHTKGDDSEYDLIVPFSPEVEDILHDLKIIRFIAKKILIQNSRKIEIEKYT